MSTEAVAAKLGAGVYAKPIEDACIHFGIETTLEKCHFIAQIMVESAELTRFHESLNYSIQGLLDIFSRERISESDARKFGRKPPRPANQEAIGNLVYGGQWGVVHLGNIGARDGWMYRGRGAIQLTGRDNYNSYSKAMYGDDRCVVHPEALEKAPDAILSAGWYWQSRNINRFADRDDVVGVTHKVNNGENGIDDRRLWLARAKHAFADLSK